MKNRILALAAVTLALGSCLPVPFDLQIAEAALTAQKMTRDNPNVISGGSNFNPDQQDFALFPAVLGTGGFDYSSGIVASMGSLQVNLTGIFGGSSYGGAGQSIPNPDPHAPPYLGWAAKSGPYLFGMVFDALVPANSGYAVYWNNTAGKMVTWMSGSSLQSLDSISTGAVGASLAAMDPAVGYDILHTLSINASGMFRDFGSRITSAAPTTIGPYRNAGGFFPLPFIPPGITRVMYYYDDNAAGDPARLPNRSFAAWYDGSAWQTWAWWETPSTGSGVFSWKQVPIDHRIDALLSTGQLLSTEGGTGRLYDRDGSLLASFPLGNLAFIGEQYVGGVARSYFSQGMVYDHTLHFNVYWIASSQLATLAK